MPYLFSYGTLQLEKVQIELFGRILIGTKDSLSNYTINEIEILDKEVLRKSNQKFHPIVKYSGNITDKVYGTVLELTEEEILEADKYEVAEYKRIEVTLDSTISGFIYIKR